MKVSQTPDESEDEDDADFLEIDETTDSPQATQSHYQGYQNCNNTVSVKLRLHIIDFLKCRLFEYCFFCNLTGRIKVE